jgi:hypothetical protein
MDIQHNYPGCRKTHFCLKYSRPLPIIAIPEEASTGSLRYERRLRAIAKDRDSIARREAVAGGSHATSRRVEIGCGESGLKNKEKKLGMDNEQLLD